MKKIFLLILCVMCPSTRVFSMDYPSKEKAEEAKKAKAQADLEAKIKAEQEKFAEEQRKFEESIRKYQEEQRLQQIGQLNIPETYFSALPRDVLPDIIRYKEFAEKHEAQQKLLSDYDAGTLNLKMLSPEQKSQLVSGVINIYPNFEQFKKLVTIFGNSQVVNYIEGILVVLKRLLTENPSNNIQFISYLLDNFGPSIAEMQSNVLNSNTQEYEGEITAKIEKFSKTDSNFVPILAKIKSFGED